MSDNLKLLERSFETGKTGWTELLLFRREFVDARREYVQTMGQAWLAAIELDLACGTEPQISVAKEPRR